MASKRRHRHRRAARTEPHRPARKRILVLCEGQNTEPQYLRGFQRWCRNPLVEVKVAPHHGVPQALVQRACELVNEARARARRERDDNLTYDEIWCVFDRDEHPNIQRARQLAADNQIEVALSNPCFELWLLLHFRESPGMQEGKDMLRLLRKHLPEYDKRVRFADYERGYESAAHRAKSLDATARADGEQGRNPTSDVFRLAESIRRS